MILNTNSKIFIIYIMILELEKMPVYSKKQVYIKVLLLDKVLTIILAKYANYNNIFLIKNAIEFLNNIRVNNHIIKL